MWLVYGSRQGISDPGTAAERRQQLVAQLTQEECAARAALEALKQVRSGAACQVKHAKKQLRCYSCSKSPAGRVECNVLVVPKQHGDMSGTNPGWMLPGTSPQQKWLQVR